jgi:hypothetical protein
MRRDKELWAIFEFLCPISGIMRSQKSQECLYLYHLYVAIWLTVNFQLSSLREYIPESCL